MASQKRPTRQKTSQPARGPGRPRSTDATQSVLDAALALLGEGESIERLSIEGIAERAGVSKATIYRRWKGKEALLLDAFATFSEPIVEPPGLSVREDLIALLENLAQRDRGAGGRIYAALFAEGMRNPVFMKQYLASIVEPRREVMRRVIRRGIELKELRADIDVDRVQSMLAAPLLHYMLNAPPSRAIPPDLPAFIVDTVLQGIGRRRTKG